MKIVDANLDNLPYKQLLNPVLIQNIECELFKSSII